MMERSFQSAVSIFNPEIVFVLGKFLNACVVYMRLNGCVVSIRCYDANLNYA